MHSAPQAKAAASEAYDFTTVVKGVRGFLKLDGSRTPNSLHDAITTLTPPFVSNFRTTVSDIFSPTKTVSRIKGLFSSGGSKSGGHGGH
jgi:hypothetical protein